MARRTSARPAMRLLSPAEQTREDVEARLHEVWEELGGEERELLVRLTGRLLLGQRTYGRLNLLNDWRDFAEERAASTQMRRSTGNSRRLGTFCATAERRVTPPCASSPNGRGGADGSRAIGRGAARTRRNCGIAGTSGQRRLHARERIRGGPQTMGGRAQGPALQEEM
jgi:hypothetical protein